MEFRIIESALTDGRSVDRRHQNLARQASRERGKIEAKQPTEQEERMIRGKSEGSNRRVRETLGHRLKIENMREVKKTGVATKKESPGGRSPAFQGALFDKRGYCLRHSSVQLAKPMKDVNGKLIYRELRANCPSCHKTTSLGGGKVRTGHRIHGTPSFHGTPSSSSRSRSKSREPLTRSLSQRSLSRGRDKKGYDTPFDSKGRCHYHKNVQLAAKKHFGGGWKVLHSVCPKCMEDNLESMGGSGGGDDRSVRSGRSGRTAASRGDARGQYDKNGCCVIHTHIQVAKKQFMGGGWKVVRRCPACADAGTDDRSVKSGWSASSRKSMRSARSATSGRYGALPFDADGYCCRHPEVQLAKRKARGGFKIIHDVCPQCARDGGGSGKKKASRRRSSTGRTFDDPGSETSSFRSGKSGKSRRSNKSGSAMRRRIRVLNLKTEDDDGRRGRYTGYVDNDHRPHGNGTMMYDDGTGYEGVWSGGSKVHGKTMGKK